MCLFVFMCVACGSEDRHVLNVELRRSNQRIVGEDDYSDADDEPVSSAGEHRTKIFVFCVLLAEVFFFFFFLIESDVIF